MKAAPAWGTEEEEAAAASTTAAGVFQAAELQPEAAETARRVQDAPRMTPPPPFALWGGRSSGRQLPLSYRQRSADGNYIYRQAPGRVSSLRDRMGLVGVGPSVCCCVGWPSSPLSPYCPHALNLRVPRVLDCKNRLLG